MILVGLKQNLGRSFFPFLISELRAVSHGDSCQMSGKAVNATPKHASNR